MPAGRSIPGKPLLVAAAVVALVRVAVFFGPAFRVFSPAIVAALLFLYAPLPYYRRRGTPPWIAVPDPREAFRTALLVAAAGAAFFFVFVHLPLPKAISPYRGTVPLSAPLLLHLLFLTALPEEVFFRGYLYDAFEEAGWEPVLASSVLFAASHVAIYPTPIRALTFFPGLLLGWGRKRSGTIWVPVAVHFLYNLCPSLIGGGP